MAADRRHGSDCLEVLDRWRGYDRRRVLDYPWQPLRRGAGVTWRVDWNASLSLLGSVLMAFSLAMVIPLIVAVVYWEDVWVFLVSMAITAGLGLSLRQFHADPELGPQEALLLVTLTWVSASLLGAIPFLLAGYDTASTVGLDLRLDAAPTTAISALVGSVVNAVFESTSGVTTTGATVLGEISLDRHSHAVLMWRQLLQWLGGMGIIVLMVAILPELAVNGAQLMSSESPGPELQKLTPKIAETARALWLIYVGFTVLYVCILYGLHLAGYAPNMDLYNAFAHGFTTLPTGGFSPQAQSIAAFSAVVQWVVIPFMVIAGINFALFWHVVQGEFWRLYENTEFRAYTGAVAVLIAVLSVVLFRGAAPVTEIGGATEGLTEPAVRHAAFQIGSLLNSTGFATADFAEWSTHAKVLLLFAMFVGGSAGSTGGGVKVVRWLVVLKTIHRELYTTAHPQAVEPVRLAGHVVDEDAVRGIMGFTLLYLILFAFAAVFFALDSARVGVDLNALEAVSASLATIGNIGPGFGRVGPYGSYLFLSNASKVLMIFLMWIGRLEIVPVLALFVAGLRDR